MSLNPRENLSPNRLALQLRAIFRPIHELISAARRRDIFLRLLAALAVVAQTSGPAEVWAQGTKPPPPPPNVRLTSERPLVDDTPIPETDIYTFYVDASEGSDLNPGTRTLPWRTLRRINSASLKPGQSVGLRRGQKWRETLLINHTASSLLPIRIGPYGVGEPPLILASEAALGFAAVVAPETTVVQEMNGITLWSAPAPVAPRAIWIDGAPVGPAASSRAALNLDHRWTWEGGAIYLLFGSNPELQHTVELATRDSAILISTAQNVVLRGLQAANANNVALHIRDSQSITLDAMWIHDAAHQGIYIGVGGGGHTISNSAIFNSGLDTSFGAGSGLHIQDTIMPSVIEYSNIYSFGLTNGDHAIYDESGGNTYRYNHIKASGNLTARGMAVKVSAPHTTFIYNLFDSIPAGGIYITSAAHTDVLNNTFYQCGTTSPFASIWLDSGTNVTTVRAFNNIVYSSAEYSAAFVLTGIAEGWHSDYNIVYAPYFGSWRDDNLLNFPAWQHLTTQDAHSLVSDPSFVDPSKGDFALQSSSPALGAGTNITGPTVSPRPNVGAR